MPVYNSCKMLTEVGGITKPKIHETPTHSHLLVLLHELPLVSETILVGSDIRGQTRSYYGTGTIPKRSVLNSIRLLLKPVGKAMNASLEEIKYIIVSFRSSNISLQ